MLFVHSNRYLPLTGLLTYFALPEENVVNFFKYFRNISRNIFISLKYFTPKNFMKFYITSYSVGN